MGTLSVVRTSVSGRSGPRLWRRWASRASTSTISGTRESIWASKAGTSTKDLMVRMGHDDMRAALIYQRATTEADEQIADRLSKLVDRHREGVTEAMTEKNDGPDGDSVPNG
jgi:hypothetical protein